LLIVPVAAILVASIRLRFIDLHLHLRYRGPNTVACQAVVGRGEDMGWFEHGSTLVVLVPPGHTWAQGLCTGQTLRAGQPLIRRL
jgi:phosphatidylserine decarboxylase